MRNVSPIKINEFRAGTSTNPTNAFIELYNSGDSTVDLSNWTLTEHPAQQPVFSTITVPAGTKLAGHDFYLLGLSNSGLAAPASAGDTTLDLSNTTGLAPGQQIQIGTGPAAETRTITQITNSGATGPRVPGKFGNAVQLSGNGEYVSLPSGIVSGLHDFTISAWVNPSANTAWSRVFDFGTGTNDYMFLTLSAGGGPLRFAITTSGNGAEQQLNAPGNLPLNTWSHVAVTLSGTTGTLYVNGQPVATNTNMTLNPAALGTTNQNWIGRSQFSADPFLAATVDDFQIYDHALSAAEIAALASGQPGAGNVASYKFDEDSGAIALDSSGNGHNATIISAGNVSTPLWQPVPDGPITVPAGSTNVPVTSTSGFKVGQKMAIGYGRTLETATVTAVGTAGTAGPARGRGARRLDQPQGHLDRQHHRRRHDPARHRRRTRDRHRRVGGHPRRKRHRPHPDRPAEVRPRVQPSLQRPGHRYHLQPGDTLRALEQRAGAGTGQQHHPRQSPQPQPRDQRPGARRRRDHRGLPGIASARPVVRRPRPLKSAGSMVLRDARGLVADSLNYGAIVDPSAAEGYQGTSGTGQVGCFAPSPDRGQERHPPARRRRHRQQLQRFHDHQRSHARCRQPGLRAGPGARVSLQTTSPGGNSGYIKHDDSDDLVVVAPVTASSPATDKQDATCVEAAGLANPNCVSFESVNKPGSYLRHENFQFHLQPIDGSSLFTMDATFCPRPATAAKARRSSR